MNFTILKKLYTWVFSELKFEYLPTVPSFWPDDLDIMMTFIVLFLALIAAHEVTMSLMHSLTDSLTH